MVDRTVRRVADESAVTDRRRRDEIQRDYDRSPSGSARPRKYFRARSST
jgi:hypothetical protein